MSETVTKGEKKESFRKIRERGRKENQTRYILLFTLTTFRTSYPLFELSDFRVFKVLK